MQRILLVALGGGLGSALRYGAGGVVQRLARGAAFPYGTLAVNVLGCFLAGFVSEIAEVRGTVTAETRTFVMAGLLGGFTTFSAFGNETVWLARQSEAQLALLNVIAQLACGLGAVWLGRVVASWTAGA